MNMVILGLSVVVLILIICLYFNSSSCGLERFVIENRPQICRHCIVGRCERGRCYSNSV